MYKKFLCAALAVGSIAVSVAPCVAEPITEVVEAGIVGCGDTPDDFGPQFWKDVDAACKGKTSCKVRLTDSYPLATLQQYACKSFFVEFICKDEIEKVEGPNLTSEATLQCN